MSFLPTRSSTTYRLALSCPVNCQPKFEITGVGKCISDQSLEVCFRSCLPMAESPLRNPGVGEGHALSKQQNVPTDTAKETSVPTCRHPLYAPPLAICSIGTRTPRCLRLGTPGLVASAVDIVTRVSRCPLSFYFLSPTVEELASGLMCRCIWSSFTLRQSKRTPVV